MLPVTVVIYVGMELRENLTHGLSDVRVVNAKDWSTLRAEVRQRNVTALVVDPNFGTRSNVATLLRIARSSNIAIVSYSQVTPVGVNALLDVLVSHPSLSICGTAKRPDMLIKRHILGAKPSVT